MVEKFVWLLQELSELQGSADTINLQVFRALEQTITYSPGSFATQETDAKANTNGQVPSIPSHVLCALRVYTLVLRCFCNKPADAMPLLHMP